MTGIFLILIFSLLAGFVLWLAIMNLAFKRVRAVAKKFQGQAILERDPKANFFGLQSGAIFQFKGKGLLLLTKTELYFESWFPRKVVQIPVSAIVMVEISNLEKTKSQPGLKVVFFNKNGKIDSALWQVTNLSNWEKNLENLIILISDQT